MFFVETKAVLAQDQMELIEESLAMFNQATRTVFARALRLAQNGGQEKGFDFAKLKTSDVMKFDLLSQEQRADWTSNQLKTIVSAAKAEFNRYMAHKKSQKKVLAGGIEASKKKQKALAVKASKLEKTIQKCVKPKKKALSAKDPAKLKELKEAREELRVLKMAQASVVKRVSNQEAKLTRVCYEIDNFKLSRVFGGQKLLQQRLRIGEEDCPFKTKEAWDSEWHLKRNGNYLFDGGANIPFKNAHVKIKDRSGCLRFRLPERIAKRRLMEISERENIPFEELKDCSIHKWSKFRTESEWISLRVPFGMAGSASQKKRQSEKFDVLLSNILENKKAKEAKEAYSVSYLFQIVRKRGGGRTFGKEFKSVAKSLGLDLKKEGPEGVYRGEYELRIRAQMASYPDSPKQTLRMAGSLGVDLNPEKIAFALVKEDGNYAGKAGFSKARDALEKMRTADPGNFFCKATKGKKPFVPLVRGEFPIRAEGTQSQSLDSIRKAAFELCKLALFHRVPITMEELDFSQKKRNLRYEAPQRAKMLSSSPIRQWPQPSSKRRQKWASK